MSQASKWAVSTGPDITDEQLKGVLLEHWSLGGELQRLYAERDLNARLQTAQGTRYLVKVSHPDADLEQLKFQNRALRHIALHAAELPVLRLIPSQSNALQVSVSHAHHQLQVRVFSWLNGQALQLQSAAPEASSALGRVLAELGQALEGCSATGAPQDLPWDLQRLQDLAPLSRYLTPALGQELAHRVLAHHANELGPALKELPRQVIHNDLNPENILFEPCSPPRVSGLIDFGDLVVAPLVCDLAVACAYLVNHTEPDPFFRVRRAVEAYVQVAHLDRQSLVLLPDLIACRQTMTLLIQGFRLARGEDRNGSLATTCASAKSRLEASFSDAGDRFRKTISSLAYAG